MLLAPRSAGSGQLARPRTRAIAHCNLFVCAAGCTPQDTAIPAARPAHAAGCLRARPRQRLIMLQSAAAANVRRPVLPSFMLLAALQRQRESHGKQGGVAPDVSHSGMSKYSIGVVGTVWCSADRRKRSVVRSEACTECVLQWSVLRLRCLCLVIRLTYRTKRCSH